jgi:hypothetical protein
VTESLTIPRRFNGPLDSGNGGFCAGAVAGLLGGRAEVSLRKPVPLDMPLAVERDGFGAVRVLDGEALIAEGHPEPDFVIDVPEPVSLDEARQAAERYRGLDDGVFSHCFVCGRAREEPIKKDGRKHRAGAAVLSADGEILAAAHALLIAPRGQDVSSATLPAVPRTVQALPSR